MRAGFSLAEGGKVRGNRGPSQQGGKKVFKNQILFEAESDPVRRKDGGKFPGSPVTVGYRTIEEKTKDSLRRGKEVGA